MAVIGTEGIYRHWEVSAGRNVMRTHYCLICRALGNCWGFASVWEKKHTRKLRNWVIWIHLLRLSSWAFVAAQTDVSELTQIVLQQDPPCLLALHCLFILLGVWRTQTEGRIVWSCLWALTSSKRLPLPQWGSLQGATGKGMGTQGDVHKLQQRGCQKEQPAVCPSVHSPPWTVLPLSLLFFSYLFLHSFFSRQYNNLSSLGCFSSSIPKPSWKIYQTIFLGQVLIWWLCLDAVQSHSFGEEWSEGLNCEAEIKRNKYIACLHSALDATILCLITWIYFCTVNFPIQKLYSLRVKEVWFLSKCPMSFLSYNLDSSGNETAVGCAHLCLSFLLPWELVIRGVENR